MTAAPESFQQISGVSPIRWSQVNGDGFEYAIQQGPHGDEFVGLMDGTCLRRLPSGDVRAAVIEECAKVLDDAAQDWNRIRDPGMANNARSYAKKIRALSQSPATDAAARRDEIARIIDEHSFDTVKMHGRQNASQQSVRRLDDALAKADLILGGSHD